jgi:superfamily I DNA/RNA helicase
MAPRIIKISGPPGTGKTSYLLRQIEHACRQYEPEKIGAVSFSKASVEEIKTRVQDSLPGSTGKNIKTIHALCFQLLGLTKSMVIDENSSKIREWNDAFPNWSMPINYSLTDLEDDPLLQAQGFDVTENRKRMARINILRNTLTPLDTWPEDCRVMFQDWSSWCIENEYWDFTRMLEEVYRLQLRPGIQILFIDECQDLSSLQVAVANQWAEKCESVIWIGDQDQSIYKFNGAVPENFRDLIPDWSTVLSQSYRVPKQVHSYALSLIRQIGTRRQDISYKPTDIDGKMFSHRLIYPDLSLDGSHMILCRCQYHLKRWMAYLSNKGALWHNPYRDLSTWNPTQTNTWRAVAVYNRLLQGQEISVKDLLLMIKKITATGNLERGIKTNIGKHLADSYAKFSLFGLIESGWFLPEFFNLQKPLKSIFDLAGNSGALLDRWGKEITENAPKIILGTYHSIKGGEADHVWIDTTSSPQVSRSIMESISGRDDETRLAYVAVTRARHTCGLLMGAGLSNEVFI